MFNILKKNMALIKKNDIDTQVQNETNSQQNEKLNIVVIR
jgi:hypothetical protein